MPESFRHSWTCCRAALARPVLPSHACLGWEQRRSSLPHRGASCAGALCKADSSPAARLSDQMFRSRPRRTRRRKPVPGLRMHARRAVLDTRKAAGPLPAENAGDESLSIAFFSTNAMFLLYIEELRRMPASSSSSSSYAHVASTSCLLEKSPPFSLCQRPLATRTPWPVRASLALHCCPAETLSSRQPQTPSLSPPPVFRNMQTPPRFALSGRIHVLFSTHWHDLRRGIPDFVLPATRSCFCWPFPTRRTAIRRLRPEATRR